MSEHPAFLRIQEDLEVHVGASFKGLPTAEKGHLFAPFASKLITFLPEFREFGEAQLSEKASHDGGVDIVSEPLEDGRRLCVQSKLRITGKDDIDGKFHDFEVKGSKARPNAACSSTPKTGACPSSASSPCPASTASCGGTWTVPQQPRATATQSYCDQFPLS